MPVGAIGTDAAGLPYLVVGLYRRLPAVRHAIQVTRAQASIVDLALQELDALLHTADDLLVLVYGFDAVGIAFLSIRLELLVGCL